MGDGWGSDGDTYINKVVKEWKMFYKNVLLAGHSIKFH